MSLNTQLIRSLKAPARPVWEEPPSKAGLTAKGGLLLLCCLGVLGPLWIVIVTSLSPKPVIDRVGGLVVIPQGITFVNYTELLSGGQVSRAIMV
ncbi:ABC transporter permease, partial [Streptomyces viridochromogenes]